MNRKTSPTSHDNAHSESRTESGTSRRAWGKSALAAAAFGLTGTQCGQDAAPTTQGGPGTPALDPAADPDPPPPGHQVQLLVKIKKSDNPNHTAGYCIEHPRTAQVCKSMHKGVVLTLSRSSDVDQVEVTQAQVGSTFHRFDALFDDWPGKPNGADGKGIFTLKQNEDRIFVLKDTIGVQARCSFADYNSAYVRLLGLKFRVSSNDPFFDDHCGADTHVDYHFEC